MIYNIKQKYYIFTDEVFESIEFPNNPIEERLSHNLNKAYLNHNLSNESIQKNIFIIY